MCETYESLKVNAVRVAASDIPAATQHRLLPNWPLHPYFKVYLPVDL